jgi:FkbM family methyltransferase
MKVYKKPHFDEYFNPIDVLKYETIEQLDSFIFINSNDIVLELGGRYGTVSTVINNILSNKKNHVVVEPDSNVIDVLKLNKNIHNCDFQIYKGIISQSEGKKLIHSGYGSHIASEHDVLNDLSIEPIESITYQEFKHRYPYNFNVLVVDCEGGFEDFMKTLGNEIQNYNKVLLERDYNTTCNYDFIENILIQNGFTKIKDVTSHCVYINLNQL